MFRFSVLSATAKICNPGLLVSNTSQLHTLAYRMKAFNNNNSIRPLSKLNIPELLSESSSVGLKEKIVRPTHDERFKKNLTGKSVSEMLAFAKNVSDVQSASIYFGLLCQKLYFLKDINLTEKVMNDKRLGKVLTCYSMDKDSKDKVPDVFVLNLLMSLYKLNPFHCGLITEVETYLLSRIDEFDEKDLVRVLEMYSQKMVSFKFTESSFQLYNKAVYRVENCQEFKDPHQLISAVYYLSDLQMHSAVKNILRQLKVLVSECNVKDLCGIFFLMARYRESSSLNKAEQKNIVSLLKEFDLNQLNVKSLNKILYSCCVFNIYDLELIEKVTNVLKSVYRQNNNTILHTDIVYTITALKDLHWKDSELLGISLNLFGLMANSSELKSVLSYSQAILSSVATLDYSIPDNLSNLIIKIYTTHSKASPLKKLDFVWSLVILGRADASHIKLVIDPVFMASVCPDFSCFDKGPKYSEVVKIQKLQNIFLAGRLEFALPTEEILSNLNIFDLKGSVNSTSINEMLLFALSEISDSSCIDSKTVIGGHFIDALLYVNSDGSFEKLENVTLKNLNRYHRICIKIQGFSDTLLNEVGPTGPFKLSIKHLRQLGFQVIVVPYQLFESRDYSDIQKFIKEEIDTIVNVESED